jgi:hypothetical protein
VDQQQTIKGPQLPTAAEKSDGRELTTYDFGDDAGRGLEGAGPDEFIIPFVTILASNSPQVKPARDGGVPGAAPGDFFNTATGELLSGETGFVFIPVARDHNYPEFIPRNLGGGFVGVHAPDEELVTSLRAKYGKFGRLYTSEARTSDGSPAEGTELQETFYLYGLLVDEGAGAFTRVILPFKSTQIRKYKGFISRADGFKYRTPDDKMVTPPLWAHRWRVTTRSESNKKGDFYGYVIRLAAQDEAGHELPVLRSLVPRSDPLYQAAREFYDLVTAGKVQADYAKAQDVTAEEDEEIPM